MEEYRSHAHSVSSCKCKYHFVWCRKYRYPVLDVVEADVEELFGETADHFGHEILALEIADDHVHLFVQTDPNHTPADIARQFKSYSVDLLPPLKGWDSPMGILGLRVSSAAQIRFRVASVTGRRPVVTKGVLSSACSSVKRAFPPARGRRPRSGRQGVQPAGPHGLRHSKCYAVHGSPSR